jgi:hypothetical protein
MIENIEDPEDNKYLGDILRRTIEMQRAKLRTYRILVAQGLPIPLDLKAEIEASRHIIGDDESKED